MTTPRLGMTLVTGTDTIGGVNPSLQGKVNDALAKLDATAGVVMCTSTTRPTTNLYPGITIWETDTRRTLRNLTGVVGDWRVVQEDTVNSVGMGGYRAVRPIRPYGKDSIYTAFPSVAILRDGTFIIVFRRGTDHATIRDGNIYKATSTDQGRTWTSPVLIVDDAIDLRDPCVSLSRSGTRLYLTYFKGTNVAPASGVFFKYSDDKGVTWSAEVRVDDQSYSASSAPVVELDTGVLVIPWYGKASGDTFDSVWTAKSTDSGATWVNTKILNGQTASINFQEPWIAMNGQSGVMAYRYNTNSSIGLSTTADNMANWTGAVSKFAGTGRPTVWYANDTTISVIYRQLTTMNAAMRVSKDGGTNFWPERIIEKNWGAAGTLGMTYAGVDKLSNGTTFVVLGIENATSSSRLFFTYMGDSGADTPYGTIAEDQQAVLSDTDRVILATQFDQNDGSPPPYPWFTGSVGDVTVTNGELTSASADNIADFAVVYANTTDHYVEADIRHVGTQSGAGVLFRYVNGTTYMLFTLETGHTTWRLYKFIGGTGTQIATAVVHSEALIANKTLRFWVEARGTLIRAGAGNHEYFNFQHTATEPGGNSYSVYSSNGLWAGLKLNAQAVGSSQNYCSRFVLTR